MYCFGQFRMLFIFTELLFKKGFNSYLELSDRKLFIEFEVKDFKELDKIIKDWLLFNYDIVTRYDIEWTDDDICRYNLYLEGDI